MKDKIQRIMENHVGRENIIPAAELMVILDLPVGDKNAERKMRRVIEDIKLSQDGLPILSIDTPEHNGYFLPRNQTEYLEGITPYKNHIITRCKVMARMKRNCERFLAGESQGALKL